MAATYTYDIFSTLDGFGSFTSDGDWGGYWGKQGPEFLAHRLAQYDEQQRMVLGATTFRFFMRVLAPTAEAPEGRDEWVARMRSLPATVVSTTLSEPFDWPDATLVSGDAVDAVRRLKAESDLPLRSHGSISMNRALLAAGLVDRIQVTVFPVISGQTGAAPIFKGAADFDLELIESRRFDGNILELTYRPTLHRRPLCVMNGIDGLATLSDRSLPGGAQSGRPALRHAASRVPSRARWADPACRLPTSHGRSLLTPALPLRTSQRGARTPLHGHEGAAHNPSPGGHRLP